MKKINCKKQYYPPLCWIGERFVLQMSLSDFLLNALGTKKEVEMTMPELVIAM